MGILVLADDMTGALEVGARFSSAGIHTIVSAKPLSSASAPVVVLDTETRHLDPDAAAREIIRFVSASGSQRPSFIYKKTDSTLRGNIQAELGALARMFPDWSIGYAPAYPALGRTVRGGLLYVHGVAVAATEFGRDELNPVRSSSVAALLPSQMNCRVFDGEADSHLADAARIILAHPSMRIAAGPAGLAGALAEMLAPEVHTPGQHTLQGAQRKYPVVRTCLVLNGSRHSLSERQVRELQCAEWPTLQQPHPIAAEPMEVATRNARHLIQQISLQEPDAALVIGGDTAFALVRELGFPPLAPIGEIVPGVPVTAIARNDMNHAFPQRRRDLFLITKAGGFGEDDVLVRVHAKLSNGERSNAG